uniref:Uncharacterized protein n=1 Tax=Arundo donax TaxID=35708 RepID=A0A0A9DAA0_ARUDO
MLLYNVIIFSLNYIVLPGNMMCRVPIFSSKFSIIWYTLLFFSLFDGAVKPFKKRLTVTML